MVFKPNFSSAVELLDKFNEPLYSEKKAKPQAPIPQKLSFKRTFGRSTLYQFSSAWTFLSSIATFSLANCFGVVSGLTHDSTPILASLIFLVTCPLAVTLSRYSHQKNKWRFNLLPIGAISFLMVNFLAAPAQALFFQNAARQTALLLGRAKC